MTRRFSRFLFLSTAMALLIHPEARAQVNVPVDSVSDLLPLVFATAGVVERKAITDAFLGSRISPPADLGAQVDLGIDQAFTLNQRIGAQLSTFPLGSAAGGFSVTFNPTLGTFQRDTESFGPTFAERPLTVGRKRLNFGVNYQRASFDHIEDRALQGGDVKNYIGGCINASTSCVFVENSVDLTLTTDTVGIFATYGVLDRLDVGVAIPIVRIKADATVSARVASTTQAPSSVSATFQGSSSASGIGDITVRGKYSIYKEAGGGVAVGVDLRLPTGDEVNLLGVAGFQAKTYVAASRTIDRVSPHINFGFTASGESEATKDSFVFAPPNEVSVVGGADFSVNQRLTVVGDVLVRNLRDIGEFSLAATRFGSQYQQLTLSDGSLTQALAAVGAKFSPIPKGLVAINVLFPLNKRGLTDNATFVVGFEYGF